jgi:hypothetical protein
MNPSPVWDVGVIVPLIIAAETPEEASLVACAALADALATGTLPAQVMAAGDPFAAYTDDRNPALEGFL